MPQHDKCSTDGGGKQDATHVIIAGVNKGGTTSLFSYMATHPDICPSDVKETCFFLPLRFGEPIAPNACYDDFFVHCGAQALRLESTPGYFYGGRDLASAIADRLPGSKIIIVLREPVERAFSFFKFMKSMMQLDQNATFDAYVASCKSIPDEQKNRRENNRYWGVNGGFYADYLEDWLAIFADRARVVFFDDLRDRPLDVLRELCIWLDIDPGHFADDLTLDVENKTVPYSRPWLHKAALWVNRTGEKIFRANPGLKRRLRRMYRWLNRGVDEPEVSATTRSMMAALYEPHNARLRELLRSQGITQFPDWLAK